MGSGRIGMRRHERQSPEGLVLCGRHAEVRAVHCSMLPER
ncbi:hypothetical protein P355_4753 [Burkholderia cenocepacia KC-01]|nr:hypothetical protein P355_4753 [Burkholderia cenocepacia KC-01]